MIARFVSTTEPDGADRVLPVKSDETRIFTCPRTEVVLARMEESRLAVQTCPTKGGRTTVLARRLKRGRL